MSSISSITSPDYSIDTPGPTATSRASAVEKSAPKSGEKRPRSSSKTTTTTPPTNGSAALIDTEVEVEKVVAAVDFSRGTMSDVVVSELPTNPFQKWNKKKKKEAIDPSICSKLVSILGVPAHEINTNNLRKFCTAVGITKMSSAQKKQCVEAIVKAVANPPKKKVGRVSVNRKRLINVAFCDIIRPKFAMRGESLSKDDMTEGLKSDENLYRAIMEEYNDSSKYNDDAHPNLGVNGDPSVFDPIGDWTKAKDAIRRLIRDYETCHANWKLSGNHGGYGDDGDADESGRDPKPFSDFIQNNKSLLYLHEFVFANPEVLNHVTGELPERAFSESTDSAPPGGDSSTAATSSSSKRNKKRKMGVAKKNNSDKALEEFNSINRQKMKALQYSTLIEAQNSTTNSIQTQNNHKRQLLKEVLEESSSLNTLKAVKKSYGYWKKRNKEQCDDEDSIRSGGTFVATQEELYEEIWETENNIAIAKKQQELTRSKLALFEKESVPPPTLSL